MTRDHFSKEIERDKNRWVKNPPLSVPVILRQIKWYDRFLNYFKRGKK